MKTAMPAILVVGLLVPAGAGAEATTASARSTASKPTITRVSPMRIKIGKTLTIRGTHFSSKASRNKVILRAKNGRSAIARVKRASRTKLVLAVPAAAERLLTKKPNIVIGTPTRLYLRVVTSKYGRLSSLRHSPVVLSGLGTRAASKNANCGKGDDWDNDLLSNATEAKYSLDPCKADTDGDGMSDGWEYWSAKDLNRKAVPYPGKKPYPNPLDKSDDQIDFDGDSLQAREEYRAWRVTGSGFDPNNGDSALSYSDGTQSSRPADAPPAPGYDTDGDGRYTDDERDADNDGLNNFIETHGPGTAAWWTSVLSKLNVQPWPGSDPNTSYSYYGAFTQRPFADTQLDDADVDGDSIPDGLDDQDNDDVSNAEEMYDPLGPWAGNGNRKNAFNPCAPNPQSRTCPRYFPTG